MSIPIWTYLDPFDPQHMRAYTEYMTKGCWPKGFLPDNVTSPAGWHHVVAERIAIAWASFSAAVQQPDVVDSMAEAVHGLYRELQCDLYPQYREASDAMRADRRQKARKLLAIATVQQTENMDAASNHD